MFAVTEKHDESVKLNRIFTQKTLFDMLFFPWSQFAILAFGKTNDQTTKQTEIKNHKMPWTEKLRQSKTFLR